MSIQCNSFTKTCATCAYWGGARELKNFGSYLEIGNLADPGACYSRDSTFYNGSPVQACASCSYWKKWEALQ